MFQSKVLILNNPVLQTESLGGIPVPTNIVYGNPGSDPRQLIDSLPTKGGVIILSPGDYYNFGLGTRDKDFIAILGESDSIGNRPRIYGNIFSGTRPGQVIYIGNIEIDGQRNYATAIKTQKDYRETLWPCMLITENVYVHDFTSNGVWPSAITFLEMYNTEIARCGGGNFLHNIYVADECDSVVLRGCHFHSANRSHPFKNKARRLLASNCKFETTNRWQEYLQNPELADNDVFLGTTLIDSVGTCEHHIVDCEFNFWRTRGTGNYLFEMQRRKTSSYGSDDPPYYVNGNQKTYLPPQEQVSDRDKGVTFPEPIRSGTFWDNTWWQEAENARGSGKLVSRFWRNRFNIVYKDYQYADIYGISNKGSLPLVDSGFSGIYDYPVPDNWFERALVLVSPSCSFNNFRQGQEFFFPDHSTRPLIPEHRKGDPAMNPTVRYVPVDTENNWVDRLPKYGPYSDWKYKNERDANVTLMREKLGYVT